MTNLTFTSIRFFVYVPPVSVALTKKLHMRCTENDIKLGPEFHKLSAKRKSILHRAETELLSLFLLSSENVW